MGFEPRPPDCSGCRVSGLQHGATTPSIPSLAFTLKTDRFQIYASSFASSKALFSKRRNVNARQKQISSTLFSYEQHRKQDLNSQGYFLVKV